MNNHDGDLRFFAKENLFLYQFIVQSISLLSYFSRVVFWLFQFQQQYSHTAWYT